MRKIQSILLLFHWLTTAFVAGLTMKHEMSAFVYAFISVFALWSMHYTSLEIEQPYGDDLNDLPLYTMQTSMNDSLVNLLNPHTQEPASFDYEGTNIDDLLCVLWSTHHDPNARMLHVKNKKGG